MFSERERRILADIESQLSVHDPRFAARMRSPRRPHFQALLLVFLVAWWLTATLVLAALWDAAGAVTVAVVTALASLAWRLYRH